MGFKIKRGVHDCDEPLVLVAGLAQADAPAMLVVGKLGLTVIADLQCLLEGLRYFVGELSASLAWNAAAVPSAHCVPSILPAG